jgi:SP family sugar:H+ symporter-like MFS transporter
MPIPLYYIASLLTGFGGFTYGFNIGVISGILATQTFRDLVGIVKGPEGDALSGLIPIMANIGAFPGIVVQAYLNDRYGRKATAMAMGSLFVIAAILQTISQGLIMFCIARAIAGFAMSVMIISVALYSSEIAPKEKRGWLTGFNQFMIATGISAAYWIRYALSLLIQDKTAPATYQIQLALQIAPAIIMIVGFYFLPNSPRWLVTKGRTSEATKNLVTLWSTTKEDPKVAEEIDVILTAQRNQVDSTWKECFDRENRKRLQVSIPFAIFQQFVGQNLLNYFAPKIFESFGYSDQFTFLLTGFMGITRMLVTFPALYASDFFGRRALMIFGNFVMLGSFFYIGGFLLDAANRGVLDDGLSKIAVVAIYLFTSGYSLSWSIVRYMILTEYYPQSKRAKCATIISLASGLFELASIFVAPIILANMKNGSAFFLYGSFITVVLIWILIRLPETKGVPLEKMSKLFESNLRWRRISRISPE